MRVCTMYNYFCLFYLYILVLELSNNNTLNEVIQYLAEFGKQHEAEYNIYYMIAALFMENDDKLVLTAMFNNQAYHTR